MGQYGVVRNECTAVNFFAGDFPIVTDVGVADAAIVQYAPVVETATGIATITQETIGELIGIAADGVNTGEPVVVYLTGEYFESALNIPEGINKADLKKAFRKKSIYLK